MKDSVSLDNAGAKGHRGGSHHAGELLAGASMLLASLSMVAIAMVDAASITERIEGHDVSSRPLWLHTFSISFTTVLVAAVAFVPKRLAVTRHAWSLYAVAAALNLTVPFLGQRQSGLGAAIQIVHVLLAGALATLSFITRPRGFPPTNS